MNDPKVMGIDHLTGLPAQELREDDQARKLVAAFDGLVRSIRNREARESACRATIHEQAKEIGRLRAALEKAAEKPCRGDWNARCSFAVPEFSDRWCASCIARAALKEMP